MENENGSVNPQVNLSSNTRSVELQPVIDPSMLNSLEWRLIGPFRGGRVVAVAGDPVHSQVFYFGSTGGGVWKTTNGGILWENVSDGFFKRASVGAIAVSVSDPNIIYVGMGETTIRGNVSHGDGVYKSTDGGKTWKHILFASEDIGAHDLAMDPNNPRILYAALWRTRRMPHTLQSGGEGCGLFKSTDGGDTWTEITRRPGLPTGPVGKIGVSVSGARADRVWAIVEAEDGAVFRSDDGGNSWQRLCEESELRKRPWYYQHICADP